MALLKGGARLLTILNTRNGIRYHQDLIGHHFDSRILVDQVEEVIAIVLVDRNKIRPSVLLFIVFITPPRRPFKDLLDTSSDASNVRNIRVPFS